MMTERRRGSITSRIAVGGLVIVVFAGIATGILTTRVETRRGVNYQVSSREIPVYVKLMEFMARHYQYSALAAEITRDLRSDGERVMAVFEWTRQNIRVPPPGWPIVDDHIQNIIVRGYGGADQMADVFSTLATYSGVTAFWAPVSAESPERKLILAFARVGGRWTVFDVYNGVHFRRDDGSFASVQELAADPSRLSRRIEGLEPGGIPYPRYLERLREFREPQVLRARLQMPIPRLSYAVRRYLGVTGD